MADKPEPIEAMAAAMLEVCKEDGIDLPVEFLQLLALAGLEALEPNQLMLSAGANTLEGVGGDEADRQELAEQVFSDMILAALQGPLEATHEGSDTEN